VGILAFSIPQMGLKVIFGIGDQSATRIWLDFDGFDGFLDGRKPAVLAAMSFGRSKMVKAKV
jgi:hypothetical protein